MSQQLQNALLRTSQVEEMIKSLQGREKEFEHLRGKLSYLDDNLARLQFGLSQEAERQQIFEQGLAEMQNRIRDIRTKIDVANPTIESRFKSLEDSAQKLANKLATASTTFNAQQEEEALRDDIQSCYHLPKIKYSMHSCKYSRDMYDLRVATLNSIQSCMMK